jgi:hypothetical protein
MDGGVIGGLTHAQISKITAVDAPTLEVIDLVALKGCADRALPDLMSVLLRNASRLGAARVRLAVVSPEVDQHLSGMGGVHRRRGHVHGHVLFKPGSERLARDWLVTPYDGEYGISLRNPPRYKFRHAA